MFAIGYHRLSQFDVALALDCDSDPFSPMNEAQRAGKELFAICTFPHRKHRMSCLHPASVALKEGGDVLPEAEASILHSNRAAWCTCGGGVSDPGIPHDSSKSSSLMFIEAC